MVERFFLIVPQVAEASDSMILLSGPPSCGKTSLLFQFAFNCALEAADKHIVFICNKEKFEGNPPCLSQGVDAASEPFRRIQMKYVEDEQGIKKYFAAFHLHDIPPAAVIIDDFGDFFDDRNLQHKYGNSRGRDLGMVRTLALCCDAVKHSKASCKVLLSDTHQGDIPRSLFIYKRWIPCLFSIKGDNQGSFILKKNSILSRKFEHKRSAKYSIALQYLVLEEIIDG